MKRLSCSFPDSVGEQIEKMATEVGISQSAVVSMAVKEYFDQKEMINNLPKLLKLGEDLAKMEVQDAKKMIEESGLKNLD
jgi:hypothetical protein